MINHPELERRYLDYCATLGAASHQVNEQLLFHGCGLKCDGFSKQCDIAKSGCALCGISETGFLRDKMSSRKNTSGWHRFGLGYYFALQASKSHEYPEFIGPAAQAACPKGDNTKVLLLCKVAAGKELQTTTDFLEKGKLINKCKEHGEGESGCAKCLSIQGKAPVGHNASTQATPLCLRFPVLTSR